MFMIRQYAACVLMVATLGGLVLAGSGIGYLLKTAGYLFVRALFALVFRAPTQDAVGAMVGRADLTSGADGPRGIVVGSP